MAVSLLSREVSDLCLGKPALIPLSASATIAEALTALKSSGDTFISVWVCHHFSQPRNGCLDFDYCGLDFECRCVGKLCVVDVICYLCEAENLVSPSVALQSPVSVILPKVPGIVVHLDPSARLLEAIDLILQGAQNLVVPIKTRPNSYSRRKLLQKSSITLHNGQEFCWLTQEDVIRFLLNSIGLFSPIPSLSIDTLDIITTHLFTIDYHSPATLAIPLISRSLAAQTSVAVVDNDSILIGEISPFTLACCDEKPAAAAIMTLSAGDLMAYIDCGGPPDDLVHVVKARLKEENLEGMLEEYTILSSIDQMVTSSSSSSSDEEFSSSPKEKTKRRYSRSQSYSARIGRRAEAIVCHPNSSLMAVMIQAIAHRVNYVWVTEDDYSLVGIVTFSNMLKVFRQHLEL